jgi:hypothetical protein
MNKQVSVFISDYDADKITSVTGPKKADESKARIINFHYNGKKDTYIELGKHKTPFGATRMADKKTNVIAKPLDWSVAITLSNEDKYSGVTEANLSKLDNKCKDSFKNEYEIWNGTKYMFKGTPSVPGDEVVDTRFSSAIKAGKQDKTDSNITYPSTLRFKFKSEKIEDNEKCTKHKFSRVKFYNHKHELLNLSPHVEDDNCIDKYITKWTPLRITCNPVGYSVSKGGFGITLYPIHVVILQSERYEIPDKCMIRRYDEDDICDIEEKNNLVADPELSENSESNTEDNNKDNNKEQETPISLISNGFTGLNFK